MNYTKFGLEVRKTMFEKGITMVALAKEIGISSSYLSEILRGTRKGKKQKQKIADTLGLENY